MRVWILAVFGLVAIIASSGCTSPELGYTPYENVSSNQKYGILDEPVLRIDDWATSRVVREPSLSETENQKIFEIVNESTSDTFTKGYANESGYDFLNRHFHVKSAHLSSIYSGTTSPPLRQDLRSVALMVYYDFVFDWLTTTNQRYEKEGEGSSTGSLSLIIDVIDYKNGEFVKKDKIVPLERDQFIAFRSGFDKIISKDNAFHILNESFTTRGKELNISVDYFIKVSGRELQPTMEGTNFVAMNNVACSNINENRKFTYTSCEVNLVSGGVKCSDKEVWCFYYL